jgi:hypothetical protein
LDPFLVAGSAKIAALGENALSSTHKAKVNVLLEPAKLELEESTVG